MRSKFWLILQFLIIFGLCLSVGSGLMVGNSSSTIVLAESSAGEILAETTLELVKIDPNTAVNDVDQLVIITGSGFVETPQVFLGNHELVEVSWRSETELEAIVPWGLAADVYDLTVVNPDQEEASLPDAFTVTDGLGEFITAGPYGGQTVQLALQKNNPSTLYALMFGAGLFLSEDGGSSWAQLNSQYWPIQLAFDAVDPDILYLGAAGGNEFYRSLDQGLSWEQITTDIIAENGCYSVYPAAHPTKAGVVYFGMGSCGVMQLEPDEGGVYYSTDYGQTWKMRNNGLTNRDIQTLAIHPDGVTLVAGTYEGNTFYSEDGGLNWQAGDTLAYGVTRVFINPYKTKQAWAITREDLLGIVGDAKIYRSDNLKDWTEVEGLEILTGGGSFQAQMAFLNDSIWLASNKLYRSTDNGINWEEKLGITRTLQAIVIPPEKPQTIYIGSDFGIEKTTDGGATWVDVNDGLAGMAPQALAVSSSDLNQVYVKTHQGIYKSVDAGNSWQYLDHGISGFPGGSLLDVGIEDDQILFYTNGCTGEFCIDISTNGGSTWETLTSDLPAQFEGWDCDSFTIRSIPLTPERVIVGASVTNPATDDFEGIFYYSDDHGQNWDFFVPTGAIDRIREIEYDPFDPNLIYAGTWNSGLWRSQDGGESWGPITIGSPPLTPPVRVDSIAIHPNDADKVFVRVRSLAVTENPEPEIWVSTDRGETWSLIGNSGFMGSALIVTPPLADQTFYSLYTSCEGGLCRSVNEGLSWSVNTSVPWPELLASATDGERSILYMGTPGGLVNTASVREAAEINSESVSGGGVYRLTEVLGPVLNIYLPIFQGGPDR